MFGQFFKVGEVIETVVLSAKEYNELLEKIEGYDKELNELKQRISEIDGQRERSEDS